MLSRAFAEGLWIVADMAVYPDKLSSALFYQLVFLVFTSKASFQRLRSDGLVVDVLLFRYSPLGFEDVVIKSRRRLVGGDLHWRSSILRM